MQESGIKNAVTSVITQFDDCGYATLCAEPGAGKTILVPWYLAQTQFSRVIVSQPRALTTVSAARFSARFHGVELGKDIGFVTGDSQLSSPTARVEYVTDGVLARRLASSPELFDGDLLIIDECHERTSMTDACFAMFSGSHTLYGDSFKAKLLLMSATLNGLALPVDLKVPAPIFVEGRHFPIDISYQDCDLDDYDQIAKVIADSAMSEQGATLVFVSGQRDMRALTARLSQLTRLSIQSLHGGLSAEEQYRLAAPADEARIILATNLAEASITIEDVGTVIDMGLVQNSYFDAATGYQRLRREVISKASATQRAGRAGRVRAGRCLRLWNENRHATLYEQSVPPVDRESLDELYLLLGKWGSTDLTDFYWLSVINTTRWNATERRLAQLKLVDGGNLSAIGELAAALPLPAMLSASVVRADNPQRLAHLALSLDAKSTTGSAVIDLHQLPKLNTLLQRRLKKILRITQVIDPSLRELDDIEALVWSAPFNLAQRVQQDDYRTADNRNIRIAAPASLESPNHVWVGGLWGRTPQTAATVLPLSGEKFNQLCEGLAISKSRIVMENDQLWCINSLSHGRFSLQESRSALRGDELISHLMSLTDDELITVLATPQREALGRTAIRYQLAFGDTRDELLVRLRSALNYVINAQSTLKSLRSLSIADVLRSSLTYAEQKLLAGRAPNEWDGPISKVPIQYSQHDGVVMATVSVRLQSVFGCVEPIVLGLPPHRVLLCFELLSPAQRPIQTTSDLGRFWQGSYAEVRKDMRARYPKHHWPVDPASEKPMQMTRKAKPFKPS